ncbi:MAG TPA: hypothetical protein VF074_06840, partial [Pyrinomonadaceae bacterium]
SSVAAIKISRQHQHHFSKPSRSISNGCVNTLACWCVRSIGVMVAATQACYFAAWFSADGKWIFAAEEISASGQVRQKAWSLDLTHLLQEGCAALRLYLANPAMIEQAKMCS